MSVSLQSSMQQPRKQLEEQEQHAAPIKVVLEPPSLLARYGSASAMVAVFAIWGKLVFVDEETCPGIGSPMHNWILPLAMTASYLVALPLLRRFSETVLEGQVDVKLLLRETMVVYNAGQVLVNFWMVYRILDAVAFRGHPLIGDRTNVTSGAAFAVWIHYCDKYLEFFDTFFMVLRGRMDQVRTFFFAFSRTIFFCSTLFWSMKVTFQFVETTENTNHKRRVPRPYGFYYISSYLFAFPHMQVSFLHVYHHVSIAWAWWVAMTIWPGGDAYFGALLNSFIHVLMYSYYTMSLLKYRCPWKKYLTQAQLIQFTSVLIYTGFMGYVHRDMTPRHWFTMAVQVFEMSSLFVLFMLFYAKTYKKRKQSLKSLDSASESESVPEQSSISSDSSNDEAKKEE